jgi:hypothetical protein
MSNNRPRRRRITWGGLLRLRELAKRDPATYGDTCRAYEALFEAKRAKHRQQGHAGGAKEPAH